MRVTLAQLPVYDDDIQQNLLNISEALRQAADEKADILLTPEGSLSGYRHDFCAVTVRQALAEIERTAAEKRVGLALGVCMEEDDARRYNQLRFYNRDGRYLGCHTKTLLCGTGDPPRGECAHFAHKPPRVFDFHGITIGGLICNDLWANPWCTPMPDPHLTHVLAKLGAKIIFHAVNGGRDAGELSQGLVRQFHEVHVRMKAQADGLYICTVDNAFPEHIGVSSLGGIAAPDASWRFTLPNIGKQVHTVELPIAP